MSEVLEDHVSRSLSLPTVALRDIIVFPHMTVNLDIGRKESIEAVRKASQDRRYLAMIMQKNGSIEEPEENDLYRYGTVVKVKQMLQLPGGLIRIQAEGISRVAVQRVIREANCLFAEVEDMKETEPEDSLRAEAYRRTMVKSFFEWIQNTKQNIPDDQMAQMKASEEPGYMADFICTQIPLTSAKRQAVLEEGDIQNRILMVQRYLDEEIQIGRLEAEIAGSVRTRMEKEQRDYYLRQKIKSIHDRLGDEVSQEQEAEEYKEQLANSGIPEEFHKKLEKEINHLATMPPMMAETAVARNYWNGYFLYLGKKRAATPLIWKKQKLCLIKTITVWKKSKNGFLNTLPSVCLHRRQKHRLSVLSGLPVWGKQVLPSRLPIVWKNGLPVFLWAVFTMRRK